MEKFKNKLKKIKILFLLYVCQPGVNLHILYLNSNNAKRTLKAEFNLYLSRERLADNQLRIS